jgi:cystathionine beta-lyase family protein involved in aluminum resistance
MDKDIENILCKLFGIDVEIIEYVNFKEQEIIDKFNYIEKIKEYNQYKVIKSMQESKLSSSDFNWSSGYGYGDIGREKIEKIYSLVFNCEDAYVRPLIASGTSAIFLALSSLLRPNDELISITGSPYDTMQEAIGIKGNQKGSLLEFGIKYREVSLNNDGSIDIAKSIDSITDRTKMIYIQRSTGYSNRKAIPIEEIAEAIKAIKDYNENVIIMVDNCYGEFTDKIEPTDVGADIMAGSLIKNPGGGLALSGGYIVGRKDLIEQVANRSTAPGIGKECGLTFGMTRNILQGLFLAPHVVAEAMKGALLVGAVYKGLGFEIVPDLDDKRSDIVQAVKFNSPEMVVEFCKGIQSASAVDSFVIPTAWDMPGYENKVIMASGGFVEGSSIELSADGPMREPYFAYFQGGLTYEHCKLGVMKSLSNLLKNNLIDKNKLTE